MFKHDYNRYETVIRPHTFFTNEEFKIALNFSPKTASTSIKVLLAENEQQNFVDDTATLSNYKVFAVLREPFSRFISSYLEVLKFRSDVFQHTNGYDGFAFKDIENPYKKLRTFIYESYKNGLLDQHLFPQDYYLDFNRIDTLIDFAYLEEELYSFLRTNYCKHELSWKKKSTRPTDSLFNYLRLNKELTGMVSEIYADDIIHYSNLQERRKA